MTKIKKTEQTDCGAQSSLDLCDECDRCRRVRLARRVWPTEADHAPNPWER